MRLITWNMLGATVLGESKWVTIVKPNLFEAQNADIICLQETGALPPTAETLKVIYDDPQTLYAYWEGLYILWAYIDVNGNRVNLAICTPHKPNSFHILPSAFGTRPALGLGFPFLAGYVYTLHAQSGINGGWDAPSVIQDIQGIAGGNEWIAAGDFNCDPDAIQPHLQNVVICPPDGPTQGVPAKNSIDYMIKNFGPFQKGKVLTSVNQSDHHPVIYDL